MFVIRVYGLIKNSHNEILLTDETYKGRQFTKFPGGGMQQGEGPIDCLIREFDEEFKLKLKSIRHFYTTDFYQASAFNHDDQIISIYYEAELESDSLQQLISFEENVMPRWQSLMSLSANDVTFPIDKKVVEMILAEIL